MLIKKCLKKSTIFLTLPPSARMFWTILNLGKIGNLMTPPWTKFGKNLNLGKFGILGTLPQKKKLKLLKLPKNHLKTYFLSN